MHRQVVGLIEKGLTAEQVLDEFVAQHGELVLMAPRKQGFNIVGYVLPGTAITIVGATMLWMLMRRTRGDSPDLAAGSVSLAATSEMSADEEARLKAELADLDS